MNAKIELTKIADELEMVPEEWSSYWNRRTGEVIHLPNDALSAAEDEGDDESAEDEDDAEESAEFKGDFDEEMLEEARAIVSDDQGVFVELPSKFDIDEYRIMRDFCYSVTNKQISDVLCDAIQGRGAFGRFKACIRQHGIEEKWYEYRDRALKEVVKGWCIAHELEYIDDEPHCDEPDENLSEKELQYRELADKLRNLLSGERDFIANMANMAALLYQELPDVNWAGFYLLRDEDLALGPFQGQPACTRINRGKGVCGAVAQRRETVVVENVKKFPGHIACDKASKSEIVVPILKDGQLLGVLDLDSPLLARFDDEDRAGLEGLVRAFLEATDFGTQYGDHARVGI